LDKLPIGKMAKLNGISEQTLRLYDKMGLITPCEVNEQTGYRYYDIKQCAQLDMIQYMKALGMNLAEIRRRFEENDIDKMRSILERQKLNIEHKMKELDYAKKALDRAIESYQRYEAAPDGNHVILEYLQKRRIFRFETRVNCYSYGMDTYEHILRSLKKNAALRNLPISYFCNVGSIIRKEYAIKNELWATEVFLFVDEEFESTEGIEEIPEGVYLCMYCDSFQKEEESIQKLFTYIKENDYEMVGDLFSEVLIEFPTVTHYERNAFIKLQVPVKQKSK